MEWLIVGKILLKSCMKNFEIAQNVLFNDFYYMRHLTRFGTVCTILKREKHPWRSVSFSKVEACNSTKSNSPRFFFTFFKLYKWYQFAKSKLS